MTPAFLWPLISLPLTIGPRKQSAARLSATRQFHKLGCGSCSSLCTATLTDRRRFETTFRRSANLILTWLKIKLGTESDSGTPCIHRNQEPLAYLIIDEEGIVVSEKINRPLRLRFLAPSCSIVSNTNSWPYREKFYGYFSLGEFSL